jgi:hypothetical protein
MQSHAIAVVMIVPLRMLCILSNPKIICYCGFMYVFKIYSGYMNQLKSFQVWFVIVVTCMYSKYINIKGDMNQLNSFQVSRQRSRIKTPQCKVANRLRYDWDVIDNFGTRLTSTRPAKMSRASLLAGIRPWTAAASAIGFVPPLVRYRSDPGRVGSIVIDGAPLQKARETNVLPPFVGQNSWR